MIAKDARTTNLFENVSSYTKVGIHIYTLPNEDRFKYLNMLCLERRGIAGDRLYFMNG